MNATVPSERERGFTEVLNKDRFLYKNMLTLYHAPNFFPQAVFTLLEPCLVVTFLNAPSVVNGTAQEATSLS